MKISKFMSVPDNCGEEFYRVLYEPGLGEGKSGIIEMRVAGRRAVINEFRLSSDWHPAWEGAVDEERIASVRSALDAALKANIRPAVDDTIVDASYAVVETCRRGRYPFFKRSAIESNQAFGDDTPDAKQRFVTLATALLQLPVQVRGAPVASATASSDSQKPK